MKNTACKLPRGRTDWKEVKDENGVEELLTASVHSTFNWLRVREGGESSRGNPEVVEMSGRDIKENRRLGGGTGASAAQAKKPRCFWQGRMIRVIQAARDRKDKSKLKGEGM